MAPQDNRQNPHSRSLRPPILMVRRTLQPAVFNTVGQGATQLDLLHHLALRVTCACTLWVLGIGQLPSLILAYDVSKWATVHEVPLALCLAFLKLPVLSVLPGVLTDADAALRDSFSDGLLDAPLYTRPAQWEGRAVPDVLLSGNPRRIEQWQRQEALRRTWTRRPDLMEQASISDEERSFVEALKN